MPKQLIKIGLSIGVSFAILALLLQMVTSGLPDDQRPSVLGAMQATSLSLVAIFVVITLVSLFVRALRYRMLLQMSGEPNVPTLRQMALVTGIRNMIVDMLPARLGELGYLGLLNKGYGVKLQHCMSSLTVAVAFDFVALLCVVILILVFQIAGAGVAGWAIGAALSALVLAVVAVIGLFVLTPFFSRWLVVQFPASSDDSLWAKLLRLLADFSDSLLAVRTAGKTTQIVGLSVIIRALKYASFFLLFEAVARPSFPELSSIPIPQVVGALIGGEVGASLPIPTFMSFGSYEAGGALVFNLLGIANQAQAVVTMLCVHIWSQLMDYLLGGTLLVAFLLIKKRGEARAAGIDTPVKAGVLKWGAYAGGAAVLGLGSLFFAYQLWATSKLGSFTAPDAGAVAADAQEWRELSKQHVSNLDGFVVFSSNRDGNHDIFRLNLSDFKLDKLTTHPHTETYPRISPDGQRVVFSRAHQPWVSQRNAVAWDIYLLDLGTGEERKIGERGTAPAWINNQEITYSQDAVRVVKVDVATGAQQTVYETGVGNPMPKNAQIQNPKFNPITKQVVFTGRQNQIGMNTGHWGTALATGDTHLGILDGCELAWDTAGQNLFQVARGGINGSLRIVSVEPETMNIQTLIDLDGEFSHEYWPKDAANDSGYMVLGASRGKDEHEHDVADYEIFLWKKGTDSGKATRLTFHTGNDNWPDVYINN